MAARTMPSTRGEADSFPSVGDLHAVPRGASQVVEAAGDVDAVADDFDVGHPTVRAPPAWPMGCRSGPAARWRPARPRPAGRPSSRARQRSTPPRRQRRRQVLTSSHVLPSGSRCPLRTPRGARPTWLSDGPGPRWAPPRCYLSRPVGRAPAWSVAASQECRSSTDCRQARDVASRGRGCCSMGSRLRPGRRRCRPAPSGAGRSSPSTSR